MYKKDGYYLRAAVIQCLDRIFYQPYHDACHRMVWKKHTYPIYFYTYQTHLNYLKVKIPPEFNNNPPIPGELWNAMTNGNGIGLNGNRHKALAIAYLHYIQTMAEDFIAQIQAAKDLSPMEEAAYQLCLENALKAQSATQTDKPKARRGRPTKTKDVRLTADTPAETARTPEDAAKTGRKARIRPQTQAAAETVKRATGTKRRGHAPKALTTTATTVMTATITVTTPFPAVTATTSGQWPVYPTAVTTDTLPPPASALCMYNDRPWLLLRMPGTSYGRTDSATALPPHDDIDRDIARDITAFGSLGERRPPT